MSNISACILSYNRGDYLCEAIDSILQQTTRPAEILVFDNGSNAQVYERVRPYLELGVAWIGSEVNRPASWNFLRAVQTAKSEYLFILHDDDRICPDFIEKQLNFLKLHDDIGGVTCNGYLINAHGSRTGGLLRREADLNTIEFYRSSAAVAIRYASDSCLPFSPVVYRSKFIRATDLREDFGRVGDAVLFCVLAKSGALAYQLEPLYECRVHGGQDANYFSVSELDRLTDYFDSEAEGSLSEREELARLLVRQHTARQLVMIYRSIGRPLSLSKLLSVLGGVRHRRFSLSAAFLICLAALAKRGRRITANLLT